MIGVFDSGVGGLTVLKHVHEKLPKYSTMYLGDLAHMPYGTKTHEEIAELTWKGVSWLFDQGCVLVILACNSASAQALREIQQTKELGARRVLGVIRPTAEELAEKHEHIGILATEATVSSNAYVKELLHINPNLNIVQHACPEWVQLVEKGELEGEHAERVVKRDVEALLDLDPQVKGVLLGCTHYPHLFEVIRKALPRHIELYDQGPIVAEKLVDYLRRHPEIDEQLEKEGKREYYNTTKAGIDKADFVV
jgi:glutamate racemase